jgi:hypothetical protein
MITKFVGDNTDKDLLTSSLLQVLEEFIQDGQQQGVATSVSGSVGGTVIIANLKA